MEIFSNGHRSSITAKLKPSYVVLGWDGAAREAAALLLEFGSEVTVIARERPHGLPQAVRWMEGDPSDPEALRRGGVESAESVLVALPIDEARAAVAAAKRLNTGLRIVASAQDKGSGAALGAGGALVAVDARAEVGREMVRLMLAETDRE